MTVRTAAGHFNTINKQDRSIRKILDLGFAFIRVGFKPSVSLAGFDSRLIQSLIDFPYAEKVQNKST